MIRIVLVLGIIILLIFLIGQLVGCGSKTTDESDNDENEKADFEFDYTAESVVTNTSRPEPAVNEPGVVLVTGAQAKELYESNDAVILLDVRNQDEFDEYHIDGSILIPYDELETRLSELPDKEAIIIVFCRAGRRSAIASEVLIANGYKSVHDMQGIDNW